MYTLMRAVMRLLTHVFLFGVFRVEGRDNVPLSGPVLICPNHIGTIDPPMVPAFLPRRDSWSMAKSEYFERPLTRWIFTSYQAFPVVRHTADRAALRRALAVLKAGHALVIYPEGTRIDAGVLAQPEPGAGFIAQRCGCPVVPVGLTGTAEALPKRAGWPRRVPVVVRFGKPFRVRQRRPDGARVSFEEAADAIMLQIALLLPAEKRGAFSDVEGLAKRLDGVTESV